MTENAKDLHFIEIALNLAREAYEAGEVPIGALVVRKGEILAGSRNEIEASQDCTAHAEILSIRKASELLHSWRLDDCELYATLEPCPMCTGAILNSRIVRVVYGARDRRLGACHTHWALLDQNPIGRKIEVIDGVRASECGELLKSFFLDLREGRRQTSKVRRALGVPPEKV